jgi:EAL domain-containing protein (putative c-di-GMP-specific phosphodiesterase class I)
MASEADFSDLAVMERAVEITFQPTGDRLSFARFGALLSPARPIGPANFGPHPTWEIEWLARNLAQQALLRFGKSAALATQRSDARGSADLVPPVLAPGTLVPSGAANEPTHIHLQHDLALAIERGELSLHYQPICAAQTRAIAGQEALLRWTHPVRGAIPPTEFIPLAEGSGEIAAIGRWVLEHALAEAATWDEPWRVSVNLSPVQFRQADLVDMVRASLARHRLPGARLELEITEGVLIDDTSRALTVLRALKRLGVSIALDDFGTGYSNLTYLRVLPLDRIKIDKSFIQDVGTSPQVDAIVCAIIGMGQALGLEVTAEGVETEEQLAFLRAHGCSLVQGYLLGRAIPGPLRLRPPLSGSGGAAGGPRPDRAAAAHS